ncbi:MAG: DinB family protein [Gemmatimonadetes bacterium]|nr:DinB family protein [Gemmatimonadota bacterium]
MKRLLVVTVLSLLGAPAAAQSPAPVADALRMYLRQFSRNLVAAADDMPVSKYGYKPTSPQQSVATVVDHLAGSNNLLCAAVAGVPAPTEPAVKPDSTAPDELKARLRRSFTFCETALAGLDDSKLSDSVPWFGGSKRTRASVILALPYDWADHYSQMANYLRLNGISPPNARVRAVPVGNP